MKLKGLRWWVIGLIGLATIINYIDRSALSIMWPAMEEDLGMTAHDYGLILNIFMFSYAIGKLVSGKMFDKVGTRFGYVISIFVWSLSSLLHFAVKGILSLGIFRFFLGISEAGNWPGSVKSNAEWFPINERAVAQGIFNSGAALGSVVAPLIIAFLYELFGWRWTFIIIGALGILWIIPWLIINKNKPSKHPWITEEEKKHILSNQPEEDDNIKEEKGLSILQLLKHKEAWGVILCRFFIEPVWWLFVGWMPIYLQNTYNFDVKEIGMFSWFPYVGAAIGSIAGGWYAGKLLNSGKTLNYSRKLVVSIAGVLMLLGLVATIMIADTPLKFVVIVALVLFGFQFAISNIQTLSSDLFDGKSVGTLAGLAGTVAAISVIILNFLIPVITKDSYQPAFILIAVYVPLSIAALFIFCKNIRPLKQTN